MTSSSLSVAPLPGLAGISLSAACRRARRNYRCVLQEFVTVRDICRGVGPDRYMTISVHPLRYMHFHICEPILTRARIWLVGGVGPSYRRRRRGKVVTPHPQKNSRKIFFGQTWCKILTFFLTNAV